MSPALLLIAWLSSYQTAPVAWALGTLMAWTRASARTRHAVWTVAFWAGPLTTAAVLATPWLPLRGLKGVLRPTPSELAQASLLPPASYELSTIDSLVFAILAITAGGVLVRLAWLGLKFARLAGVRRRARPSDMLFEGLPVRLSDDLQSPLLAGLWRPVILLPARFGEPEAAEAAAPICRHEAAHAARWDNLRLLVEELALALFWFNIIQSRLRARMAEAREEICDLAAVDGLDAPARQLYARNLLDCLAARSTGLLAVGLIKPPRRHATMRIEAILTPRPQRRRLALAVGLTTLIAVSGAGVFAWSASLEPAPTSQDRVIAASTSAVVPIPASSPSPARRPQGKVVVARRAETEGDTVEAVTTTDSPSSDKSGPIELIADQMTKKDNVATWSGRVSLVGDIAAYANKHGLQLRIDSKSVDSDAFATAAKGGIDLLISTFKPNGQLQELEIKTPNR